MFSPPPSTFPLPYTELAFPAKREDVELQAYLAAPSPINKEGPLLVLLHGANFSARSFSLLLPKLTRSGVFVLSYDVRGHGKSENGTAEPTADVLVEDCFAVIREGLEKRKTMLADAGLLTTSADAPEAPEALLPVCLVGHSLGGCIVARCATLFDDRLSPSSSARLAALVMMDMVEETALAAILHMKEMVETKMPHQFSSMDEAVNWSLSSGTVRLRASAATSVPYQLRPAPTEEHPEAVEWRAWPFMLASRPHWHDWFEGTNERFLSASCPKLLILADVEALDSTLTIAQMQGKFEVKLIAGAGHTLHEDAPDKVGEALTAFISRQGITKEAEKALLEAKLKRAKAASAAASPITPGR